MTTVEHTEINYKYSIKRPGQNIVERLNILNMVMDIRVA